MTPLTNGIWKRIALFCVTAGLLFCSREAVAQFGVDPGWGLTEVTCQQGLFGTPFVVPVFDVSPPATFCRDTEVSVNFGHIFIETNGACENGISLETLDVEASWINCTEVLSGEASADYTTTLVDESLASCLPSAIEVGEVEGNGIVRDFFLGTIVAAGLPGFTDCSGAFSLPIPPSISTC